MRKRLLPTLATAAVWVCLTACYGSGVSTGVYVGVGVPGPYVGYPGYGGYIGPPPVIYYDQDAALAIETGERYAFSPSETNDETHCEEGPKGTLECVADSESEVQAADEQVDESEAGN